MLVLAVVAVLMSATLGYWMVLYEAPEDDEPDPDQGPRFVWESMNGPPGGNVNVFEQNPYNTSEIYAGAGMGLYLSIDGGRNFVRQGNASIRNVTHVSFAEDFALVSGDHVWTYEYATGTVREVYPGRDRAYMVGDEAYVVRLGNDGSDVTYQVLQVRDMGVDTPVPDDLDVNPPLVTLRRQVSGEAMHYLADARVLNFLPVGDRLLLSVALKDMEGRYEMEHHDVYLIDPEDGSHTQLDLGFDDELAPTTIAIDPDDDGHLVSAGRRRLAGDERGYPISDLVRESTDGGETWGPFTDEGSYEATWIKDVDIHGGHVYFTRVLDWILRTDVEDHSAWHRIDMATVGQEGRVAWVAWIGFDLVEEDTVYAGLDIESGFTGTLRSTDGMVTWETICAGIPSSTPSNIIIDPEDPDTLITAGNVAHYPHITRDGGRTWQRMMAATSMGDEVAYDPHDPDHIILASERTDLFESWDGGVSWQPLAPNFYANRIPDIEWSPEGGGTLHTSIFGIGLSRMEGLDQTESLIDPGELEERWDHMYSSPDYAYDLEMSPDGSGVVYATYSPKVFESHSSLWRQDPTKVEGEDWTEVLRVNGSAGMTSVAIDPMDADNVYVGATGDQGTLYGSSDGGETWDVLSPALTFSTVHEMAIDPTDERRVYAAPWGGGMWRSSDAGASWEEMDVPTVSVSAILFDPGSGDHMWIGDRTRPSVYETVDGGDTWMPVLELDPDLYYRVSSMALHDEEVFVSVFNIEGRAISVYRGPMSGTTFRLTPGGPVELGGDMVRAAISMCSGDGTLFAASHVEGVYELRGGEWIAVEGELGSIGFNGVTIDRAGLVYLASGCDVGLYGQPRVGDAGVVNNIYRSPDRGVTWEALLEGDPFGAPVKRIVQHPEAPEFLVAATGNGVWVSGDAGETWRSESEGLDYLEVGSMVVGTDRVYVGTLGGGVYAGAFGADHSIEWSPSTGPRPFLHNVQVVVDPADPDTLYATSFPGGVFKSTDGGATWGERNFAMPSFSVEDPLFQGYYSLAVDPTNSSRLYLGIYGHGLYVSRDAAGTWFPVYAMSEVPPEMRTLNVKRIALDPRDGSRVYMATTSGLWHSPDGGETWGALNEGLDSLDLLSVEVSSEGTVYVGSNGYGLYFLGEGDEEWTNMRAPFGIGRWAPWERRLYQYIAIMFDPDVEGRVYMGHFPGGFFVSEDDGASWRTSGMGLGNDGIFSLTYHPEDHDTFFAGTYNGIWRSDDRGERWYNVSTGLPSEQWPFCVVIDDENTSIMYSAMKNGQNKGFFGRSPFAGQVMKSTDGGASWFPIMDGLVNMSEYYQIVMHPDDHDVLFVSSTYGVFISRDAGLGWEPFNDGMPVYDHYMRDNVADNMKMSPDKSYLVLCIVGYGVWKVDITQILEVERTQ